MNFIEAKRTETKIKTKPGFYLGGFVLCNIIGLIFAIFIFMLLDRYIGIIVFVVFFILGFFMRKIETIESDGLNSEYLIH